MMKFMMKITDYITLKVGDYYYPNIVINDEENITLGKYGIARLQYLKSHKRGLWSELIMTEKLTKHLKDVDDNASNKVKTYYQ